MMDVTKEKGLRSVSKKCFGESQSKTFVYEEKLNLNKPYLYIVCAKDEIKVQSDVQVYLYD